MSRVSFLSRSHDAAQLTKDEASTVDDSSEIVSELVVEYLSVYAADRVPRKVHERIREGHGCESSGGLQGGRALASSPTPHRSPTPRAESTLTPRRRGCRSRAEVLRIAKLCSCMCTGGPAAFIVAMYAMLSCTAAAPCIALMRRMRANSSRATRDCGKAAARRLTSLNGSHHCKSRRNSGTCGCVVGCDGMRGDERGLARGI